MLPLLSQMYSNYSPKDYSIPIIFYTQVIDLVHLDYVRIE